MSAISSTYNGHKPAVNDHTVIDYLNRDTENNAATGEPRRDPFHHRANYHDYGKKDEDREEEKSLTAVTARIGSAPFARIGLGSTPARSTA